MTAAFVCWSVRTPFGMHGGGVAEVRRDDLGVVMLTTIGERNRRDRRTES